MRASGQRSSSVYQRDMGQGLREVPLTGEQQNLRERADPSNSNGKIDSVHVGHQNVGEKIIRLEMRRNFESLPSVVGRRNMESGYAENFG